MAFERLTWGDLDTLTRKQLLDRLVVEQQYWQGRERAHMTAPDLAARAEFARILFAVVAPDGPASQRRLPAKWVHSKYGARAGYWSQIPGRPGS
ncbi:hypothetical protein AB0H71_02915 [Nocardia sp. NPDC050697]|uniref:hypothetical protein n=1 Tax=Nocardia sp. NPDC050697 TaxID=3155158 RepID=UPI0033F586A3